MANSASVHYETVSTAFQVIDIADPLATAVPPDWLMEDVWSAILEDSTNHPDNFFAIVRNEKGIIGYCALDSDFEPGVTAAVSCSPIAANQIVAGSLPLIELIPLFQQHFYFLF